MKDTLKKESYELKRWLSNAARACLLAFSVLRLAIYSEMAMKIYLRRKKILMMSSRSKVSASLQKVNPYLVLFSSPSLFRITPY